MTAMEDPDAIASLLTVLGNFGYEAALMEIRNYLDSDIIDIRKSAVTAISSWPDASPMQYLGKTIDSEKEVEIHNTAMRGYIRCILLDESMSQAEKAGLFSELYPKSINVSEKTMVITGMSRTESIETLQWFVSLMGNPDNPQNEVEQALLRVAGNLKLLFPEEVVEEMKKAAGISQNQEFVDQANLFLKSMS
jgi:hypothetical protein